MNALFERLLYTVATQLRILICWCRFYFHVKWKEIEENVFVAASVHACEAMKKLTKVGNLWVTLPLKTLLVTKGGWLTQDSEMVLV